MKILLEDNVLDPLSVLYLFSYRFYSVHVDDIIFANGNGNLENKAKNLLLDGEDLVLVFLDSVPYNMDIVRIYNKLARLSKKFQFRLVPLNIVCSEYNFIQSISKYECLHKNLHDLRMLLAKKFYGDSRLITEERDRKYVKNFEKFCKLYLKKGVKQCITEGAYFKSSCFEDVYCTCDSMLAKSLDFIQAYPLRFAIPGCLDSNVDINDIWNIHRRLVNEFNSFVRDFAPYMNKASLKLLKPLK